MGLAWRTLPPGTIVGLIGDRETFVSDFPLFDLTEEHAAIRAAAREVCEDKVAPNAAAADETAEFPRASYEALRAADLHGPHIPVEYGGAGADALATAIVIEEVARVCAASSLIPAVNKLGTVPLLLAGSEELKRRYLPPVARGEAMFSYCLSEPEAGSDAASMGTRAIRDGDHYVLDGVKRWITNAGESEFYTVFAVTEPGAGARGISAFVVERSDPGVSFGAPEKKLGVKGSPTREVYLDSVRIPADRIIGAPGDGFPIAMRTLDHTRVTIAAQAVGIAQGALDVAVDYIRERRQFDRAVSDFQGVQFMVADMAMKLEAARQLTYVAAGKAQRGEPDLGYVGAAAKCLASDTAMAVTTDAVQLLGGYGYTRDFPGGRRGGGAQDTPHSPWAAQNQPGALARPPARGA